MGALAATMRHHSPAFNALIRHPNKEPFLFGVIISSANRGPKITRRFRRTFLRFHFLNSFLRPLASSKFPLALLATNNEQCTNSGTRMPGFVTYLWLDLRVSAAFLFLVFGSLELDDMATAEIAAATSLASISFSSFSSPESLLLRLLRLTPTLT